MATRLLIVQIFGKQLKLIYESSDTIQRYHVHLLS